MTGRVIINTGMGFEGPVHRANFDAVDSSPVRYIIFTQGHVDHVGGLDSVRDPDTTVVAQANWTLWRDDNERLIPYRASRSAFAFKDTLATGIRAIQRRLGTKHLPAQSVPSRRSRLRGHPHAGGRRAADGADLRARWGDQRLAGGVAAGRADMPVREYFRSDLRAYPQPGHYARRPVPGRVDRHRLGRAGT